jgi:hypothetical protein
MKRMTISEQLLRMVFSTYLKEIVGSALKSDKIGILIPK